MKKLILILCLLLVMVGGFLFFAESKKIPYEVEMTQGVSSPHFRRVLSDLLGPPFVDGNQIVTLKNGEQIFPAMLEAIAGAKKTITFESYIYWSGDIGKQFSDALSAKARQGVRVHVLLDWMGSEKLDLNEIQHMIDAGVEVERYHKPHWYSILKINNRTHRKLLVIDGQIGFTGGVGIADEWTGNGLDPNRWRDTHYRVEGPVVAQLQAAFLDNWMKIQPKIHSSQDYFPDIPSSKSRDAYSAQMFKSSSREGTSSVHIMYLLAIAEAKESIHLESAYFVPDDVAVRELLSAAKRGVDIKIIVPGELTDSKIVRHASRARWGELLQGGIQIFEYQKARFHCKVLVVDGEFVSVGSTNFDERSFSINDEANLNVLSRKFAQQQIDDFTLDLERSKQVRFEDWEKRPLTEKILESMTQLLRTQL